MKKLITRVFSRMDKKQKTHLENIEKKYGKEPVVKSDTEIKVFLNKKGYKSLSRLIEAK